MAKFTERHERIAKIEGVLKSLQIESVESILREESFSPHHNFSQVQPLVEYWVSVVALCATADMSMVPLDHLNALDKGLRQMLDLVGRMRRIQPDDAEAPRVIGEQVAAILDIHDAIVNNCSPALTMGSLGLESSNHVRRETERALGEFDSKVAAVLLDASEARDDIKNALDAIRQAAPIAAVEAQGEIFRLESAKHHEACGKWRTATKKAIG